MDYEQPAAWPRAHDVLSGAPDHVQPASTKTLGEAFGLID